MYVFRFTDGKFYKQPTHDNINSKTQVERWKGYVSPHRDNYYLDLLKRTTEYKTNDINKAKLFNSHQAVRSSNAYSWGGTIHEVNVNISLKSK